MYFLKKPDNQQIKEFLQAQSHREFTYPAVGATGEGDSPSAFVLDHNRIHLGQGKDLFHRAKQALCNWRHFQLGWVELHRSEDQKVDQIPEPGQTVVVLAHVLGIWVLNACRVVYLTEETEPIWKFTFAYGTLPEHAESGEERFQVEWHPEDDSVWYDILAFSRPHRFLTKLSYPYVRRKQKQFAQDSMQAMKDAVTAVPSEEGRV